MKIIGYGYPCMDINVLCDKMPDAGELSEMRDFSMMGGGKVCNAAIAAARLGAETAFIGGVGRDRYGRLIMDDFLSHGVDVKDFHILDGHTSVCFNLVDSAAKEKHYIQYFTTVVPLKPGDLSESCFDDNGVLMLYKLDEMSFYLIERAHEAGMQVMVDGDEFDRTVYENLDKIDILICSEYFYNALYTDDDYEQNLLKLHNMGPGIVVVTLGEKGCAGYENGSYFRLNAYQVTVNDTTGAGDVFHGAFARCIAEGYTAVEAAKFSSAVSAVKCIRLGGRVGIPTVKGTRHFMETGEILPEDFEEREQRYKNDAWKEEI